MATEFTCASITVAGRTFFFDGNGKITLAHGTCAQPKPNAFSLTQVPDCPGSTPTCRAACYVNNLEKAVPEIHALYRQNSENIRAILSGPYCADVVTTFANWITENCPHGFRWHVSGDVFSMEYARFIRDVCQRAPDIFFWIYTRSFEYLPYLVQVPNLVINLSADRDNYALAKSVQALYVRPLRICYLTAKGEVPTDLPMGSVIFPDYALRGRDAEEPTETAWWKGLTQGQRRSVCPADYFGQDENTRCGPCSKCLR